MGYESQKSRLGTLLLAGFLGMFGAHRFYVEKYWTGFFMLALTCTGVGTVVSGIWVLIDFVSIAFGVFKDKKGNRITRW